MCFKLSVDLYKKAQYCVCGTAGVKPVRDMVTVKVFKKKDYVAGTNGNTKAAGDSISRRLIRWGLFRNPCFPNNPMNHLLKFPFQDENRAPSLPERRHFE